MADKQRRMRNKVGNLHEGGKLVPLEWSAAAVDSRDDATREKRVAEELQQTRAQIELLQEDRSNLLDHKKASLKKIHYLKIEVEDYQRYMFKPGGIGELKKNYEYEIKEMEAKIAARNSDIAEQKQTIQNLYDQKGQLNEDIESVKAALKEQQRLRKAKEGIKTSKNMRADLEEVLRQKEELEKSVQNSQRAIAAGFASEQRALRDVREAISMAGDAIAEKEAAQKRQQVMEKESSSLAKNVGQIIDKAAINAEMKMEDLRKTFKERQVVLLDEQFKLQEQIQNQEKLNQVLKMRCARLVEKCKGDSQQIENLNLQLQSAVTTLEETGGKIKAQETPARETKLLKKRIEESDKELHRYKEKSVQEKKKYKNSLKVITKHFEDQIYLLRTENCNLKADKHFLNGGK